MIYRLVSSADPCFLYSSDDCWTKLPLMWSSCHCESASLSSQRHKTTPKAGIVIGLALRNRIWRNLNIKTFIGRLVWEELCGFVALRLCVLAVASDGTGQKGQGQNQLNIITNSQWGAVVLSHLPSSFLPGRQVPVLSATPLKLSHRPSHS